MLYSARQILESGIGADDGWIRNGPLCGSSDAVIKTALVGIIAAICISKEESIDATSLEKLCQLDPVLKGMLGG